MERGGFRGRGRGRGVAGGRGGRGGGRDGQHHHQEQQGRGSNQGWSRGQEGHVHTGPNRGGWTSGRGWGTAAGAGPSFAQVLSRGTQKSSSSFPPASVVSDPVVSAMASVNISEQVLPTSSLSSETKEILLPIKRPDNGGTRAVKKLKLLVNHFPIKFDPEKIIRHYDVDVKPKVASSNGHPVKVSNSVLSLIRKQMSLVDREQFPLNMTAYDGKKSIFSAVELPTGEFLVQLSESSYLVTLKLVNELRLSQLEDYLSGKGSSVPRDVLQGLDVATKENLKRRVISFIHGSQPMKFHQGVDLGHGIIASREPKQSLKLTSQGLALCLDYSMLPVRKSVPVIDYLGLQIDGFNIKEFRRFNYEVESALKGLEVYKTHLQTDRRHKIAGLTYEGAQDISFCIEDQQVRLVDYFKDKYDIDIMYKDIPCLELGKKKGSHSVPMELCVIAEGQRYPKEWLDRDTAKNLKNLSLAPPMVRKKVICDKVRDEDGPCGGEVVQNFGMEVSTNMTEVVGRVLGPPELNVGAPRGGKMKINPDFEKCHWNLVDKRLVEGKNLDRWAVLDFTPYEPHKDRLKHTEFIPKLINRCNNLGIRMGNPLHYQMARMDDLKNGDVLQEMLEKIQRISNEKGKGRLELLLCVMSRQHPGYGCLKFVSETKVGMMTQCCLSSGANDVKDQYLAHLAMKINAKLGGHNVEIIEPLLHFNGQGHVMFVGADVNHPGFNNLTSPSIAAVVASMSWPAPNSYAARIRPQDPKSEKIRDFGEMCLELIEAYVKLNNVKPAKIIIFRDGVSETQFDMVLNEELEGVRIAFQAMNYFPTITVIVAQKRHHTRFFPETKKDGSSSGNVPPGTVVDSTVVDHFGFHFHLFSHYGSIGTSKSTQYNVLWDEHGLSSDNIQQLTHSMCFTFARCTKPVSLIPPVYYADLAAYRGRLYQQVLDSQSQASSRSSSSSSTSQPSSAAFDKSSYKVHPHLENSMFFL